MSNAIKARKALEQALEGAQNLKLDDKIAIVNRICTKYTVDKERLVKESSLFIEFNKAAGTELTNRLRQSQLETEQQLIKDEVKGKYGIISTDYSIFP